MTEVYGDTIRTLRIVCYITGVCHCEVSLSGVPLFTWEAV